MRLRSPPITDDNILNEYLKDVYHSMLYVTMPFQATWGRNNVVANLNDFRMNLTNSTTISEVSMPMKGNIVGISITASANRTAGTLTVRPSINSSASPTLLSTLNAITPRYSSAIQQHVDDPFDINDSINVELTTTADFAPATIDIIVSLFFKPGTIE